MNVLHNKYTWKENLCVLGSLELPVLDFNNFVPSCLVEQEQIVNVTIKSNNFPSLEQTIMFMTT